MTRLIPIDQATEEFGVSRMSLFRYINTGHVTRYRRAMDRKTYVDADELKRLLVPKPVKNKRKESGRK